MASPSLDDLMYAYFSSKVPAAVQAMYTGGAGVLPIGSGVENSFTANSQCAYGSVADIAVNTNCAAAGPLPAGMYLCEVHTMFTGGVPADADTTNIIVNGAFKVLTPKVIGVPSQVVRAYFRFAANGFCNVKSILAGTAGVTYSASIQCTKLAD